MPGFFLRNAPVCVSHSTGRRVNVFFVFFLRFCADEKVKRFLLVFPSLQFSSFYKSVFNKAVWVCQHIMHSQILNASV